MNPDSINKVDNLNTLQINTVKFARILRQLGLRISSAELIDASKAISSVDILSKTELKIALQATLVKTAKERVTFNKAFDLFFVSSEEKSRQLKEREELEQEKAALIQQAEEELTWSESRWQEESMYTEEVQLELTQEQLETYIKLPEQAKQQIKNILEQASGNSVNNPHELIQRTLQGALNYWKYYLEKQKQLEAHENNRQTQPFDPKLTGIAELDLVIEGVSNNFDTFEEDIHYRDMQNISEKDFDKVGVIIRRLARLLATRLSRRYHLSKKKQKIDIRRTIRNNIRYGGVPLELKYRTKQLQKPELLLLCDVSASMVKYAGFILHFVYGLASSLDYIESFVFSEKLANISSAFKQDRGFSITMTSIINESTKLGKGTDLNLALTNLNSNFSNLINKRTTVIIVSDAKTLQADKAAKELAQLRDKVKEVIWLNTLPKKDWKRVKTIAEFQSNCTMFECYTLAQLEAIMTRGILA